MEIDVDDHWLSSPLGRYLLQQEKAIYDQYVSNIFGYHALQLGMLEMDLLAQSRIPKLIKASGNSGDLHCENEYLPLSAASIDLLCLPHALEFSQNPHQTLREVERVLVPEGHVILTGFNPLSTWGLRRKLSKQTHYPWCGKGLTMGRVKDWLALLGLEYMHGGTRAYILPINDEKWIGRQQSIEHFSQQYLAHTGGVYYIVAKKRVASMTLLKPNWKKTKIKSHLVVNPQKSKPIKHKTRTND